MGASALPPPQSEGSRGRIWAYTGQGMARRSGTQERHSRGKVLIFRLIIFSLLWSLAAGAGGSN